MNASSITKITSWLKFLGKNLRLVGCATVCTKSEVMLTNLIELGRDAKASFVSLGRFISNVFSYTGMNNWLAETFIAKKCFRGALL